MAADRSGARVVDPPSHDADMERSSDMGGLTLHPMKEIRVVVSGEHRSFVTEMLDKVQATGYTIIGNVSGKGHHGVREAHFMFSEQESLVMIMTVVPEDKVEPILAGLRPLFDRHSGVMFVSDVAVSRREYFGTKTGDA
jgi:nitrogen regulatory protein PII